MVSGRRVMVAAIAGIFCGIACVVGALLLGDEYRLPMVLEIVLNRAMIGFIIGKSAFHIHYLPHGIMMGFAGSLPIAIPAAVNGVEGMFIYLISGIFWGMLIEIIVTKLFKFHAPSPYAGKHMN